MSSGVKIHQIPHVIFETTSQFFKKTLHHSPVAWDTTFLYFFSGNFIWLRQNENIKEQNFRLSTAHMKFHQICTLMGSFCWKYIKFRLKKHKGVMSHDTEEWCKIWRKTIRCFKIGKNLVSFDPSSRKSQKFGLWLVLFEQST